MDDGIQFGEVEEAAPNRALRPDQNRHFAVAAYGSPVDGELPVFVDLDVLADMEDHAQSDTSVELGGVLLGGQYEDDEGRPFVVVSDSLRAQHYESTKGSFTFTHDTWSAISREREQFPEELQMVGWYHTHPDWGVFLSGMDMFICDNFFNKKLDVAYVIDPCRGDRGMFQWTGDPRQRVRRQGGYFVTASRFREAELEHYVGELSGNMPVTTTSQRSAAGGYGAPVVHLHQPHAPPPPPWQGVAIAGALAMQFLLMALIAWKVLVPDTAAQEGKLAAAFKDWQKAYESRQELEIAEERLRTQGATMDRVVNALKGPGDSFTELQANVDQVARLEADVAARDAQVRDLENTLDDVRTRLTSLESKSENEAQRLKRQIASLESDNKKLETSLKDTKKELAKHVPPADEKAEGEKPTGLSIWWWVGGGALAALVLVAGVWWMGERMSKDEGAGESPEEVKDQGSEEAKR
ncbi:MAG TPA: Mov34/MPN/PAD-1 family protein [Pirellulaceae bacterium]|nr:Mov34/MPN/PAD-1 family protein [Pirellulaceae bacterium]